VQQTDIDGLSEKVADALSRLLAHCRSPEFLRAAMDLRSSRMTADLPALPKAAAPPSVTRDTRVRQSPLAISWLRPSFASLDFSLPGGHIAVHPGVEPELRFISSTESFRVAELPGASSDEVKIALVTRLIDSGFLEVAE
jgi:hypothetical protein